MAIHPLKQVCRDLITSNRATLDNMQQLVDSWPDSWKGDTAGGAGGARGFTSSTTAKNRARSRSRSGGGRGARLQQPRSGDQTR